MHIDFLSNLRLVRLGLGNPTCYPQCISWSQTAEQQFGVATPELAKIGLYSELEIMCVSWHNYAETQRFMLVSYRLIESQQGVVSSILTARNVASMNLETHVSGHGSFRNIFEAISAFVWFGLAQKNVGQKLQEPILFRVHLPSCLMLCSMLKLGGGSKHVQT